MQEEYGWEFIGEHFNSIGKNHPYTDFGACIIDARKESRKEPGLAVLIERIKPVRQIIGFAKGGMLF